MEKFRHTTNHKLGNIMSLKKQLLQHINNKCSDDMCNTNTCCANNDDVIYNDNIQLSTGCHGEKKQCATNSE